MAQQTALDWLKHELFKAGSGTPAAYSLLFEQAKQMEKEQIMNAHISGYDSSGGSAIDYYNHIYGIK